MPTYANLPRPGTVVEMYQAAYDNQGADRNQEVFPAIRHLRTLLIANWQPAALAGGAGRRRRTVVNS
jgi:hypothetical protein